MIKNIKQHPLDYIILMLYTLISFGLIMTYENPQKRLIISTLFAVYYFIWAIFHHLMIKRITLGIVLEYLLVTVLGFVTLQVIFFPAL